MKASAAFITFYEVMLPTGQLASDGRNGCLIEGERSAHVFQGALRDQPVINPFDALSAVFGDLEPVETSTAIEKRRVLAVIEELRCELPKLLALCDYVVAFIPMIRTETFIQLISQIPPGKLTVVMCEHSVHEKYVMLGQAGLTDVFGLVTEECQGRVTMGMFFDEFLRTGKLPPEIGADATEENPGSVGLLPG